MFWYVHCKIDAISPGTSWGARERERERANMYNMVVSEMLCTADNDETS